MKINKFVYKPAFVEGVIVTEENMEEVAAWCNGVIMKSASKFKGGADRNFVKVEVLRPVSLRQTQAFEGDAVVKLPDGQNFRVYTKTALRNTFDQVVQMDEASPSPV